MSALYMSGVRSSSDGRVDSAGFVTRLSHNMSVSWPENRRRTTYLFARTAFYQSNSELALRVSLERSEYRCHLSKSGSFT